MSNSSVLLVLPHQLFKHHVGLINTPTKIVLVEAPLHFDIARAGAWHHKQQLVLQRAAMQAYQHYLQELGHAVVYYDAESRVLFDVMADLGTAELKVMDPVNTKLKGFIQSAATAHHIEIQWLESQGFINSHAENTAYRAARKRWFMADFYQQQRKKLNILMDNGKPLGGKWSFDADNRKKIPKAQRADIPQLDFPVGNAFVDEAQAYIDRRFPKALGQANDFYYPITFSAAEQWLEQFFMQRFARFGDYEDALVPQQNWLYHSVLSPMLNIGLLTPLQVVNAALTYAQRDDVEPISLASLEGFIRQIIGWREFMRATYDDLGPTMRRSNHWQHKHRLPNSFYQGTTGIDPIDDVIARVLDTGYCHHIERLMVIGGFMFLCEIHPDDIYRWFMSLFVDAYDWVMVPNVYAMSQHADGGLITTKPYFSGSAYLRKMGYDTKGEWSDLWDALYWRWIWRQRSKLSKNPRWAMMCRLAEKMDSEKMNRHLQLAEDYLAGFKVYR